MPLAWRSVSIGKGDVMKGEFSTIIEAAPEGGFWAI
jgi:hypothetical protein